MDQAANEEEAERPGNWQRLSLGVIALGFVTIFVIAIYLKPDPRGFGTHQQLGLPPCTFKALTGFGCPHCGMTTSFSNIVRGRFDAAWMANPLGILLASAFALSIPWCLGTAFSGRWIWTDRPFQWFVWGMIVYLTLAIAVWLVREFV